MYYGQDEQLQIGNCLQIGFQPVLAIAHLSPGIGSFSHHWMATMRKLDHYSVL
jgi:hypothetical protein